MKKILIVCFALLVCMFSKSQSVVVSNTADPAIDNTSMLEVRKPLNSKLNLRSMNYSDTSWLQFSNRNNANAGTDFNIIAIRENGLYFNTRSDIPGFVNDSLLTIFRSGLVGIGTKAPTQKLDVVGSIRMRDGSEGQGKIMQSDANGVASWQPKTFGFAAKGTLPAISNMQSIPNAVETNVTVLNNEEYDAMGMYNPTTGVVNIPESGVYHVDFHLQFTGASAGTYSTSLKVNGNAVRQSNISLKYAGVDNNLPVSISSDIFLTAGNLVTISVYQNSGMTQLINGGFFSSFNMHKLY